MKDTAFFVCYDEVYKQIGDSCVASIEHFYPEVDVFPFILEKEGGFSLQKFCDFHLQKGRDLLESYKRIISVDADSIMTNFCPDLFGDFDFGVVQNNLYFFGEVYKIYLNAGLTVCTDKRLWDEWMARYQTMCKNKWEEYNEQNALNDMYKFNKDFNIKLLEFDDRSYGISSYNDYPNIHLKNHELYVGEKKLCMIHFAGRDWITEEASKTKRERIKFEKIIDGEVRRKLQFYTESYKLGDVVPRY